MQTSSPALMAHHSSPFQVEWKDGRAVRIRLRRTSNFHAHLRKGAIMRAVAKAIMAHVRYLVVMPNTGPIISIDDAEQYHSDLMMLARQYGYSQLKLLMTIYHTAATTPRMIEAIAKSSIVWAVKHYPPEPGVTTDSGHGIPLEESDEMLRAMIDHNVPLLGHFESVRDKHGRLLDPLEGEAYYVKEHLWPLRDKYFGRLRICFEHATTKEAIDFVEADFSGNTVLTATPHQALCTHDDHKCSWGNHLKCKPRAQTPDNRAAVLEFITSGDERAIAGDDTAAHLASTKLNFETAANGCFWTSHGIAAYARAFEDAGRLNQGFEKFMSLNGPRWWGLKPPTDTITLRRETVHDIPDPIPVPEESDEVIPLGWTTEPDRLRIGFVVEE